jgi:hypothetical protein
MGSMMGHRDESTPVDRYDILLWTATINDISSLSWMECTCV